jgi:hypothetical protein
MAKNKPTRNIRRQEVERAKETHSRNLAHENTLGRVLPPLFSEIVDSCRFTIILQANGTFDAFKFLPFQHIEASAEVETDYGEIAPWE